MRLNEWLALNSAGEALISLNRESLHAHEALGDYWAGPNHTLPTGGAARFSSPLSVDDFVKKTQFMLYDREALRGAKDAVIRMAEAEGLYAHARSVAVRFEEEP